MIDVTSNEFWEAIHSQIDKVSRPGVQLQLMLAAVAIGMAVALSFVVQFYARLKFPKGHKYRWVADSLLPTLFTPTLAITFLLIAGWAYTVMLPQFKHMSTISGFAQVATVWLVARILLFIAQRHFMAYLISGVLLFLTLLSVSNLLAPAQETLNEITFETSTFRLSLLGVIKGIFSLIVLFWGASVLSKTGESWLRRLNMSFNLRELSIKLLRITLYIVASILTLSVMGVDLTALTVFGGALGVGLGFGLQKITSNFISGIILLCGRTIQTGDLIQIGADKGWVKQLAIRHTLIETADGREMLIPNEDIITSRVTNWTYSNTRARIDINLIVAFGTDPAVVINLLLAAAKAYTGYIADPAPAAWLVEFPLQGMQFQLAFWIPDVRAVSTARSEVMQRIASAFKENNVVFGKP